jgi:hypothetical protein
MLAAAALAARYRRRAVSIVERIAGRPLAQPSVSTLRDVTHRGVHAARHSRIAGPKERGDVFNLDLHIAVIADLRAQLEQRGASLVDWTLSGHSWVAGRPRDPVAIVNERTWFSFSPRMAKRFRRVYGSYLRSFRGFAATYPPCFALLYKGLAKPTLAVAATRYEWPFTHYAPSWEWLDAQLREGVEQGWLTLAANNRADADYLENYTGLKVPHIPSACAYPALTYTGRQRAAVICTSDDFAATIARDLRSDAIPLRAGLGSRYSQAALYDQRALVFMPYNVSIMALFEHYTACAPIYVPSRSFLKELMREHPQDVLSSLSFTQVTGHPAARNGAIDLNDVRDGQVIDWYLDRADFYDAEWMPRIRQFDSWKHLDHLLAAEDPHEISAEMAHERPARLERIAALWDELPWMRRLANVDADD